MAEFGAKYPCFKGNNDGATGAVIGKLVAANLTVNLASGEIYADDALAEQLSEFSSGSLAMETDDMTDANATRIYGVKSVAGEVTYNQGDTAPLGKLGYYKVLMRNGQKYYKGYFYPQVRAALGNDNAQTKGNAITFQTSKTTFTIFADDNGDWRKTKEFTTESAARSWVNEKVGIGTVYEINISVQGVGEGESVDKIGAFFAEAGEDFEIAITGTPTALYDNGVESKASITGGKYTLSAVALSHDIAIIF